MAPWENALNIRQRDFMVLAPVHIKSQYLRKKILLKYEYFPLDTHPLEYSFLT